MVDYTPDVAYPLFSTPEVTLQSDSDPYSQYILPRELDTLTANTLSTADSKLRLYTDNLIASRSVPTSLRRAAQAIAGQEYVKCNIVNFGSSTSEGHGVTTYSRRYLNLFARSLRARPGGGFAPGARVNTFPGYPIALSNGASIANVSTESAGWAGRTAALRDADDTITFTPPTASTGFSIVYGQYSGGPTISYSIDGGAAVAINTGSPATTDRFKFSAVIPIAAGTQHTITITRTAGTGFAYIRGIEWFVNDESTGVHVYEGGRAGWASGDYATGTMIAQWQPAITAIQPDLVVMQLGSNDFTGGVPAETMYSNLSTIISAIDSVMSVPTNYLFVFTAAAGSASPNQIAYKPYSDAVRSLAASVGGHVVDSQTVLPSPGLRDTRYVTGDNTHLDDRGHAMLGQLCASPLLPAVPTA